MNPGGVDQLRKARIGRIDQWASIRGTDRKNPIVLYIHGGLEYVAGLISWWFSRGWEEYFAVVPMGQ